MVRVLTALAVAAAAMMVAPDAEAHRAKSHSQYKKHRIGKVHYGGKPGSATGARDPNRAKASGSRPIKAIRSAATIIMTATAASTSATATTA